MQNIQLIKVEHLASPASLVLHSGMDHRTQRDGPLDAKCQDCDERVAKPLTARKGLALKLCGQGEVRVRAALYTWARVAQAFDFQVPAFPAFAMIAVRKAGPNPQDAHSGGGWGHKVATLSSARLTPLAGSRRVGLWGS